MRVEILHSESVDRLEQYINAWLGANKYVKVHDIKFQADSPDGWNKFYAMIIYSYEV